MQIIRTAIWVLLLVALLLFSIANWGPTVMVRIWEGIVVDTKIPAVVIVSFVIGFVPMWLYHRGSKWKMSRRIASLENAARLAVTTPVAPPSATVSERPVEPEPVFRPADIEPTEPTLDQGPHSA